MSGLGRTRPVDLVAVAALAAVVVAIVLRTAYSAIPQLTYVVPVPLVLLAAVELVAARRIRAVVRHEPHARPMPAITIARAVALGKASALVGAGCAGAAAALAAHVYGDVGQVRAATSDFVIALVAVAGAVLLVVAGLILERSGVDPGADETRRDARDRAAD